LKPLEPEDGELRTAPRTHYILAGITRGILLRMASELDIPVSETPILAGGLQRASEVFLCGTTTGSSRASRAEPQGVRASICSRKHVSPPAGSGRRRSTGRRRGPGSRSGSAVPTNG
jgi:branched-subunit amino acid aminotransferase/4-amino-4-deoxychorismate lyase